MPMMGMGVQLPASAEDVSRVFALLDVIASPAKAKAALDGIVAAQAALDERQAQLEVKNAEQLKLIGEREAAAQAAEKSIATAQAELLDGQKRLASQLAAFEATRRQAQAAAAAVRDREAEVERRSQAAAASEQKVDRSRGEFDALREALDARGADLDGRERRIAAAEAAIAAKLSRIAAVLDTA